MSRHSTTSLRLLAAASGAATLALLGTGTASAAPTPVPDPSCHVPSLSVTPTQGVPGSSVTIKGLNFGGCPAKGSNTKPSATITVKIAFAQNKKGETVLQLTTKTDHSFTATVKVPTTGVVAGTAGFAAAGLDPATGLTYAAETPFAVTGAGTSSPTPTASTSTSSGGGVPTAVPAGNGGLAASTSTGTRQEQTALGGAGVLLLAAGGLGFTRRRRTHRH